MQTFPKTTALPGCQIQATWLDQTPRCGAMLCCICSSTTLLPTTAKIYVLDGLLQSGLHVQRADTACAQAAQSWVPEARSNHTPSLQELAA